MCIQSFRNGENQLPYNLSEPLGKLSVNGKTGANASTQRAKETTDAQLVERVYVQSAVIVQGHPTAIFGKISVRKTIWDLEFSEHLL